MPVPSVPEEQPQLRIEKRYSEDQPRDDHGKFMAGENAAHSDVLTEHMNEFHKEGNADALTAFSVGRDALDGKLKELSPRLANKAIDVLEEHARDAEGAAKQAMTKAIAALDKYRQPSLSAKQQAWVDASNKAIKEGTNKFNVEGTKFNLKRSFSFRLQDFEEIEERFMNHEVRSIAELRAEGDAAKGLTLTGYAAVFNAPSKNLGGFVETVVPGAFKRSLADKGQDVKCLFNHDPNVVLGSSQAGTLTIEEDQRGLKFTCRLDPNQQAHRDIHASVQRGDIRDCSFAFNAPEAGQQWTDGKDERGRYLGQRKLTDVDLYDVSAVTFPAYSTTSVVARSVEQRAANAGLIDKKTEKREDESLQDQMREVEAALTAKFPREDANGVAVPPTNSWDGKYWVCETYDDRVIAQDNKTQDYFSIPYMEDGDNFAFGTPQPVEKEWVPTERVQKQVAEYREASAAHLAMLAAAHKDAAAEHAAAAASHADHADAHKQAGDATQTLADDADRCMRSMGGCETRECRCQNRMVNPDEVWYDDPELDDLDNEDDNMRSQKKTRRADYWKAETRSVELRDGKVRTKVVGGKNLEKRRFAHVGEPDKTETWKMPMHDAAHVSNAMRSEVASAIPVDNLPAAQRKIKAAAKRLGMVTDESRAYCEALPMDEGELEDMQLRFELAMRSDSAYSPR